MRLSTQLNYAGDAAAAVAQVQAMEAAGLDIVWVAEAYSFDAVSTMGFLAAHTSSVQIASGILPLYTRTPTLLGCDLSELSPPWDVGGMTAKPAARLFLEVFAARR